MGCWLGLSEELRRSRFCLSTLINQTDRFATSANGWFLTQMFWPMEGIFARLVLRTLCGSALITRQQSLLKCMACP